MEVDYPATVADLLFRLRDKHLRPELEAYRVAFENEQGPTDMTLRYTSTWPEAEQNWLFQNAPKLWFDGLPPFAQGYIRMKVGRSVQLGSLDDLPTSLIQLFVSRQLGLGDEGKGR